MIKKIALTIMLSLIFIVSIAAQENGDDISIGKYYKINSTILKETRTVLVSLPDGYAAGKEDYPVLFVLYADQVREYFAESVAVVNRLTGAGNIPPMIIAGITNRDRYGDLLPVSARAGKAAGAGKFLSFISSELLPWLKTNYRIKDYNIIMGPQAGATFAIYALDKGGNSFGAVIINNPFWPMASSEVTKETLRGMFASSGSLNKFIHITYKDDYWGNKKLKKYVHNMEKKFSEATVKDLRVEVNYLAGNDDFIVPTGVKAGLKRLYDGYKLDDFTEMKKLEDVLDYYKSFSDKLGYEIEPPYLTLVFFGDHLIKAGQQEEGERTYHHVIKTFPASVDGLYRMAEIYRKRGEKVKALDFYKKCVERLEDMARARDWIKKLEAELGN